MHISNMKEQASKKKNWKRILKWFIHARYSSIGCIIFFRLYFITKFVQRKRYLYSSVLSHMFNANFIKYYCHLKFNSSKLVRVLKITFGYAVRRFPLSSEQANKKTLKWIHLHVSSWFLESCTNTHFYQANSKQTNTHAYSFRCVNIWCLIWYNIVRLKFNK